MVKRLKSLRAAAPHRAVHSGPDHRDSSQTILTWLSGIFIVACVLLGGDTPVRQWQFLVIAFAGTALLTMSIYVGGWGAFSRLTLPARVLILLFVLLAWVEVVPLPPGIWRALPGREVAAAVMDATAQNAAWRPATLDLAGTLQACAAFLWLGGLLIAVLQLTVSKLRILFMVVAALAGLSVLVGFFQFASSGAQLNFYNSAHDEFLLGFFSNKNHTGLFLAITIFVVFALSTRSRSQTGRLLFFAALILIFAALFATFSRAGLLLGTLAAGICLFVLLRPFERKRRRSIAPVALALTALAAVFAVSNVAERSMDRFSNVGEDSRLAYWEQSWPLVVEYFPVGAGLATFSTLFRVNEKLEWVDPTYLNHAHNDYIEILIEVGAIGAALVGLGILVLVHSMRIAWLRRDTEEARYALIGGGIALLCALHSSVDYPLRRLAIAAIFILGYGIAMRMLLRVRGETGSALSRQALPRSSDLLLPDRNRG